MGLLSGSREIIGLIVLVAGAVLAAIALTWWLFAAFRATRKGGPLTLAALGALLAVAPFSVHALDGRVLDLGRAVQLLEGQLHFRLAEPGGTDIARSVRIESVVAALGAAILVWAILWLMLRALGKETWPNVQRPVFLLAIAVFLIALPFVVNAAAQRYIDLGPREKIVDGEMHLTLTGWDQKDYGVLRNKREATVLQMANPDVTDATLEFLKGMSRLRELDLSNTRVTDSGLAALQGLPLERLRLARTNVTDTGFKDHLAGIDTLKMLDLSGTKVTTGAIEAWKKAQPGRRALH